MRHQTVLGFASGAAPISGDITATSRKLNGGAWSRPAQPQLPASSPCTAGQVICRYLFGAAWWLAAQGRVAGPYKALFADHGGEIKRSSRSSPQMIFSCSSVARIGVVNEQRLDGQVSLLVIRKRTPTPPLV